MARKFFQNTPSWVFALLAILADPVGWINVVGMALFASGEMPQALSFMSPKVLLAVVLLDKAISRTLKIYHKDDIQG